MVHAVLRVQYSNELERQASYAGLGDKTRRTYKQ